MQLYVLWPQDFEFSATPWMKFLRLHNRTEDMKNGGYNDLYIDNQSVDAGGKGRFRVWRDGNLILGRTDVPTISEAGGTIDNLYLFTYWNNEKPPTNHVFVDDLIIATSVSPPPNTDAAGNPFIGDWIPKQ